LQQNQPAPDDAAYANPFNQFTPENIPLFRGTQNPFLMQEQPPGVPQPQPDQLQFMSSSSGSLQQNSPFQQFQQPQLQQSMQPMMGQMQPQMPDQFSQQMQMMVCFKNVEVEWIGLLMLIHVSFSSPFTLCIQPQQQQQQQQMFAPQMNQLNQVRLISCFLFFLLLTLKRNWNDSLLTNSSSPRCMLPSKKCPLRKWLACPARQCNL
jgi:hypothetical protein